MASASMNPTMANLLSKPEKTTADLQAIIDQWHQDLVKNETSLIEHARKLDERQELLSRTTESFIQSQDLLAEIDRDLQKFQSTIQSLTKYNDEFEKSIEQLNNESKKYLPTMLSNAKTERERSVTYEMMESVDQNLRELETEMSRLNELLHIDSNDSIIGTLDELQTCSRDVQQIEETIQQMKIEQK